MRLIPLLISFLLTLLTIVNAAKSNSKSNVINLTKEKEFNAQIGKDRPALVEVFAPWCGHCKKLAPIYEQLADSFSSQSDKVLIGQIDGDSNRKLSKNLNIKGFPTLLWFPKNSLEPEVYEGRRDLDSLVQFVQQKLNIKSKKNQQEDLEKVAVQLNHANFEKIVLDEKKNVLVEFYAPWCGHCKSLAPIYEQVAKDYQGDENCVIAQFDADNPSHKEIAKKYGVSSYPTLLFFPQGSSKTPEPYSSSRTEASFIQYLNEKCLTYRTSGGMLSDLAGRLPSMDSIASRFYSTDDPQNRTELVREAKEFVDKMRGSANATVEKNKAADYYTRVMDKILSNSSYLDSESSRLKSMITKHLDGESKLAPSKLDEIKRKSNILSTFKKRTFQDRNRDSLDNKRKREREGKGKGEAQAEAEGERGEERIVREEL